MHAIVKCQNHLQDRGTVIAVGGSLLTTFGLICGPVVAHDTIRCNNGEVFYLIEHAPDSVKVGDDVRIRISISG